MAEYIERDKLLEKLHEIGGCGAEPDTWADGYDKAIDAAYGLIQRTPAADVVPVVRCMDCQRLRAWKNRFGYSGFTCTLFGVDLSPNDFCSYADSRADT